MKRRGAPWISRIAFNGASALGIGCIAAGVVAVRGSFERLGNPLALLRDADPVLLRWSMLLDEWGSNLLLIPLALALWRCFVPRGGTVTALWTLCGLAFSLIGAVGASLLAVVRPPLMDAHSSAPPEQRVAVEPARSLSRRGVVDRDRRAAAAGTARPMRRDAAAWREAFIEGVGRVLQLEAVFALGLAVLLTLLPIWTLCCGIELPRQSIGASSGVGNEARPELSQARP